jgi:hypothetical protein
VQPTDEPAGHEHGHPESDDHAYADEQIGENDSGALLYDHGPSVGRMASSVHRLLTPKHEIFLRGGPRAQKMPNAQNLVYVLPSLRHGGCLTTRVTISTTDIAELRESDCCTVGDSSRSNYRLARRVLELIADPMAGHTGHRGLANHRTRRPPTKAPKQPAPIQIHGHVPNMTRHRLDL